MEIGYEIPTEVDLFHVLNGSKTEHTARWYYERFFGLDEEMYYLLECASREPERSEEIIKICREIYDERTQKKMDNFGKNEPEEGFDFNLDEIKYDDIESRDIFEFGLQHDETKRDEQQ